MRRWIPKTRQFIHTNRPLEFRFQCSLGSVRSRTISVVFEEIFLMFFLMAMSRANKWLLTVLFTYAAKQVTETASVGVQTVYGSHFSVAFSEGKIFEAKVSTLRSMIEGASGEVTQSWTVLIDRLLQGRFGVHTGRYQSQHRIPSNTRIMKVKPHLLVNGRRLEDNHLLLSSIAGVVNYQHPQRHGSSEASAAHSSWWG